MTGDGWRETDPAYVTEAVHYALRFGLTGKAHRKWTAANDGVMARAVMEHLLRANHRILQGPPRPPHSTGEFGRTPGGMPDGWNDTSPP